MLRVVYNGFMATTKISTTKRKVKKAAKVTTEEFKVKGEMLLTKVKALVKEGNVREITIKDKKGKTIVVIPLTLGVVGGLLVPPLAVVGTIAALVTECTIEVKRRK